MNFSKLLLQKTIQIQKFSQNPDYLLFSGLLTQKIKLSQILHYKHEPGLYYQCFSELKIKQYEQLVSKSRYTQLDSFAEYIYKLQQNMLPKPTVGIIYYPPPPLILLTFFRKITCYFFRVRQKNAIFKWFNISVVFHSFLVENALVVFVILPDNTLSWGYVITWYLDTITSSMATPSPTLHPCYLSSCI